MSTPTPQSKASMDPKFEKRFREHKREAKKEYDKRKKGDQVKLLRPDDWQGDPFDVEAMHDPFDRSKANDDYVKAVEDPESPGVTGDLVATTTMIEELASMERAFRNRFMRRPRAMAHLLSRKQGHGHDKGPFVQNGIEYVRSILRQAKAPQ